MDMDDGRTESPRIFEQTDKDKVSVPLSNVLTTMQIQEIGPPAEGELTDIFLCFQFLPTLNFQVYLGQKCV